MLKPPEDVFDLDVILAELGAFGRYQLRMYAYIQLPILFSAIFLTQFIFTASAVDYRCAVPECEGASPSFEAGEWAQWALLSSSRCERYVSSDGGCSAASFSGNSTQACTAWLYESSNTIVAEFDLACQEWKRTLVGTVHNAGVFAALAITAIVSDTFGRKIALVITATASGVVGIARAFSKSYGVFLFLEFLDPMVGAGVYSTGFILALEMVGLKRRVLGGNIISSTFALGQVAAALAAWAFPYWKHLTLFLYSPVLLFVLYYFVIEESVRWLLSKGRKKEAARIIFKAAAINKKKLSPTSIKMLTEEPEQTDQTHSQSEEHISALSVFKQVIKSKTLVVRVVIVSFWWISLTFIYYGLSINSVTLAGNMYVNFILTSLIEIPGYFLSFVTLDRFGRKTSIITSFFICGIALIALPFVSNELNWLQITLNMVGKLTISMAFSSIYIYTSELFPTTARHTLLAACSMFGRIGSLLAPQTPLLMRYMEALPYLIFGVMALVSGLLMLLTPETLRRRLPDTVTQAENINSSEPSTSADKPTDIVVP